MLIRRAIKHLTGLIKLQNNWSQWQNFNRKIYCCLTVDLDEHNHHNSFPKGCAFLVDIFAEYNLEGAVTWFYNCHENNLTKETWLLREIKKRRDEVALHTHFENTNYTTDIKKLQNQLLKEKANLEDLTKSEIKGFRSGRFLRTPQILGAIKGGGFTYDSSFTYGRKFQVHGHEMDDRTIGGNNSIFPLENGLLEFPVWEPFPDLKQISTTGQPYFITNLIHPFNLVWRGCNNRIIQQYYRQIVNLLSNIPTIQFVTMSQACQIWLKQTSKTS